VLDERRFAELVMQLGVVEAEIAPLHALAMQTGDEVSRGIGNRMPSPQRGSDASHTAAWRFKYRRIASEARSAWNEISGWRSP